MGQCAGTKVFDELAEEVLFSNVLDNEMKVQVLIRIINTVISQQWYCGPEWDCEKESFFCGDPLIQEAFNRFKQGA